MGLGQKAYSPCKGASLLDAATKAIDTIASTNEIARAPVTTTRRTGGDHQTL